MSSTADRPPKAAKPDKQHQSLPLHNEENFPEQTSRAINLSRLSQADISRLQRLVGNRTAQRLTMRTALVLQRDPDNETAGMTSANAPASVAAPSSSSSDYGPENATGDIFAGAGATAEVEAILRTLYQRADEAIVREAEWMVQEAVKQGADPAVAQEKAARWVVEARNQAKVKIRQWDLDVLKKLAEESNVKIYGDPIGPSYDQLKQGDPSRNIKPRSDADIVQGAKKTRPRVNKWVGRLRIAGRIMIAIDIGISAWTVSKAPEVDRPRVLIRETAGLAGAAAGGWGGAKLGGMAGAAIGAWFGGAGAVPGAAIGAIIGGVAGAIGGGMAGRALGDFIADQFYPPEQTEFEGQLTQ